MPLILVTGACGFIGSHTVVQLLTEGFDVLSIDNFDNSYPETYDRITKITGKKVKHLNIDLCNLQDLEWILKDTIVDAIIHFASLKSVPESVEMPLLYYGKNLNSLINLLYCVKKFKIPHFIFSSSCAVYGNPPDKLPKADFVVNEGTSLQEVESPYASTKVMCERILKDFMKTTKDTSAISLRYFNPVGAHESGMLGENAKSKVNNNLVSVITQSAKTDKVVKVFGNDYPTRDGTCIRDYVHVMDISNAHILALKYLIIPSGSGGSYDVFNLGTGNGVSVLETIKAFEKVTGKKLKYEMGPRRAGDIIAITSDSKKAKDLLGWEPKYGIEEMVESAWKWEQYKQ